MESIRSFIALDLPESLKKELETLLLSLKKCGADVKWVRPANLHLTLKFLGDVTPEQLSGVKDRLAAVAERQKPFVLHCVGLGGFPDLERPRVLWVGTDEGESELKALARAVESETAGIEFPREQRDFSAHLTLGRVRGGKNLGKLVRNMKEMAFSSAEKAVMDHLTLYKSTLTPGGSVYDPISVFPFQG
ncbi:MAG: RNA 2',3'-cyclic phosphodiesterase [Candidatus Omnitrophota bacterium]